MFEPSLDVWYAWLGVAVASSVAVGVVLGFPTATPPAAGPVADTVDDVATSPHDATQTVELPGRELKLDAHGLSLRNDGGTSHATFAYGPVTPVGNGSLEAVLRGETPEAVFADRTAFRTAVGRAQQRNATWRPIPDDLVIRRVTWGDFDATLVG